MGERIPSGRNDPTVERGLRLPDARGIDAGEQPEGIEPHYEGLWTKKNVNRLSTKKEAHKSHEGRSYGLKP